ncbi:MAG: hypothetical protein V3V96_16445 [Acidiferrobacterales bacterium]
MKSKHRISRGVWIVGGLPGCAIMFVSYGPGGFHGLVVDEFGDTVRADLWKYLSASGYRLRYKIDLEAGAVWWQDEERTSTSVEQVYMTRYDCAA